MQGAQDWSPVRELDPHAATKKNKERSSMPQLRPDGAKQPPPPPPETNLPALIGALQAFQDWPAFCTG